MTKEMQSAGSEVFESQKLAMAQVHKLIYGCRGAKRVVPSLREPCREFSSGMSGTSGTVLAIEHHTQAASMIDEPQLQQEAEQTLQDCQQVHREQPPH